MVDGSAVSSAASLMELSMQLHGGNCVDSFKAVVLVLPQWWEDILREVYWSWKGVGITLGSKLVLHFKSEARQTFVCIGDITKCIYFSIARHFETLYEWYNLWDEL